MISSKQIWESLTIRQKAEFIETIASDSIFSKEEVQLLQQLRSAINDRFLESFLEPRAWLELAQKNRILVRTNYRERFRTGVKDAATAIGLLVKTRG